MDFLVETKLSTLIPSPFFYLLTSILLLSLFVSFLLLMGVNVLTSNLQFPSRKKCHSNCDVQQWNECHGSINLIYPHLFWFIETNSMSLGMYSVFNKVLNVNSKRTCIDALHLTKSSHGSFHLNFFSFEFLFSFSHFKKNCLFQKAWTDGKSSCKQACSAVKMWLTCLVIHPYAFAINILVVDNDNNQQFHSKLKVWVISHCNEY